MDMVASHAAKKIKIKTILANTVLRANAASTRFILNYPFTSLVVVLLFVANIFMAPCDAFMNKMLDAGFWMLDKM